MAKTSCHVENFRGVKSNDWTSVLFDSHRTHRWILPNLADICGAKKPCRAKYSRSPRLPFDFGKVAHRSYTITCQRGGCRTPSPGGEAGWSRVSSGHPRPSPAITICPTFPRSLYTYCHVILSIPRVVSLSQQTSVCIIPRFPALPRRCPSPSPIRSTPFPVPCAPVPVPSPIRPPSLRERPIQCHEMHYPLY